MEFAGGRDGAVAVSESATGDGPLPPGEAGGEPDGAKAGPQAGTIE